MLNGLFFLALIATLWMAFRSYKQWDAYNRAAVTRTAMVNQVTVTIGLGVLTLVLFVLRGFLRF